MGDLVPHLPSSPLKPILHDKATRLVIGGERQGPREEDEEEILSACNPAVLDLQQGWGCWGCWGRGLKPWNSRPANPVTDQGNHVSKIHLSPALRTSTLALAPSLPNKRTGLMGPRGAQSHTSSVSWLARSDKSADDSESSS